MALNADGEEEVVVAGGSDETREFTDTVDIFNVPSQTWRPGTEKTFKLGSLDG